MIMVSGTDESAENLKLLIMALNIHPISHSNKEWQQKRATAGLSYRP